MVRHPFQPKDQCPGLLRRRRSPRYANALNPGAIATNLQRHVGGKLVTPPGRQKTPEQGAATSVLLATSPGLEGSGGRYFDDCNEAPTVDYRDAAGTDVAFYALDPANAHRLWDVSELSCRMREAICRWSSCQ